MDDPRVKEALLYKRLDGGKVRCGACERCCEIEPDKFGFCHTKRNIGGRLHTVVYGDISSLSVNPIEKKPLFHFHPGSRALTVGTWSCNFTCPWCQNWEISKSSPNSKTGTYISPQKFMELMEYYRCQGTSISFNEPTMLLEYALDVFDLAKRYGYYNTYITNGYMSDEALRLLIKHGLDAMNIDIKGDQKKVKQYCGTDVEKIWRNAVEAMKSDIHVEITTLVTPDVNDRDECLREIASRIRRELGKDVPWHLTAYHPAYKFSLPSTPVSTLERGRDIGIAHGLRYVYLGNVPGHPYENTYCPTCNGLLIERYVLDIKKYAITPENMCPHCNEPIPIIGQYSP